MTVGRTFLMMQSRLYFSLDIVHADDVSEVGD